MTNTLNRLVKVATIPALVLGAMAINCDRAFAGSSVEVTCDTKAPVPTVTATISSHRPQDSAKANLTPAVSQHKSDLQSKADSQSTAILSFLPEYFSPESALANCQKTAESLHDYYNHNQMNYLASDTINGKPVVCAVERRGIKCDGYSSEILFSLNRSANPIKLLYDMLGNDFKGSQLPSSRTVSRIYTDLRPIWWPF